MRHQPKSCEIAPIAGERMDLYPQSGEQQMVFCP